MSLGRLMIHRADVEHATVTSGKSMTSVQEWKKRAVQCPCRVQPDKSYATASFSATGKETYARIHFCPPVQCERDDRIHIVDGPGRIGQIWEVVGEFEADTMGTFTVVFAKLYGAGVV